MEGRARAGWPWESCCLIVTVRGGSRGEVELPGGGGIYAVYSQATGVSRGAFAFASCFSPMKSHMRKHKVCVLFRLFPNVSVTSGQTSAFKASVPADSLHSCYVCSAAWPVLRGMRPGQV